MVNSVQKAVYQPIVPELPKPKKVVRPPTPAEIALADIQRRFSKAVKFLNEGVVREKGTVHALRDGPYLVKRYYKKLDGKYGSQEKAIVFSYEWDQKTKQIVSKIVIFSDETGFENYYTTHDHIHNQYGA